MTAPIGNKYSARSVKEQLYKMFPVFRSALPLAIGIHRTIFARLPDLPIPIVRAAISLHTSSTPYLRSISTATERYDLDGAVSGEVTEEQRAVAKAQLKDRFAKSTQRIREQQAEKLMQKKLVQLVDRFKVR
ncbi:MAG: ProQ activator of osmoprotectant transporter prop [Rhodocyclaceae bacterium]|nr:MAG: ProQ activator of osmoprotectant transporter prop [Rhodocyclaceae bacterium]